MKTIRDLIYLDLGKATSILSQIEGGLLKQFVEKDESIDTKSSEAKLGINVLGTDFSKNSSDSKTFERIKVLHHELIDIIENWLIKYGFELDLNEVQVDGETTISSEQFRELIKNVSYVRAEGFATIDDFSHLQEISKNFPKLVDFINKSNQSAIGDNDEVQEFKKQLFELKKEIKREKDNSIKAKMERQISEFEHSLKQKLTEITMVESPDDWVLEGISMWIEQFNPNQIHFRVKPFDNNNIEITGNLKRDYFIDTDIEHLLFTYGAMPNVKLTIFGLITSIPPEENHGDNEENSKDEENNKGKSGHFQFAFRKVFQAIAGFEEFSGFNSYPNIKIYPIAVYRKIISYYEEKTIVEECES